MPELPEMQALSERLDAALAGHVLRRADLLGSPRSRPTPLPGDLKGRMLDGGHPSGQVPGLALRRRDLRIVLHLSQAGRLDVETPPKKTKPRGAVARFVFGEGTGGLDGEGIGILVREYGTQRKASWWVLGPGDEGPLADLGPEPGSREFAEFIRTSDSQAAPAHRSARPAHGVGHRARLGRRHPAAGATLALRLAGLPHPNNARRCSPRPSTMCSTRRSRSNAQRAGGLSESSLGGRFKVHGRFGEPCPTCGTKLERVSFESYEMAYCPTCQTGGKILADRRLSRLLK